MITFLVILTILSVIFATTAIATWGKLDGRIEGLEKQRDLLIKEKNRLQEQLGWASKAYQEQSAALQSLQNEWAACCAVPKTKVGLKSVKKVKKSNKK